jgi:hypothetical protein
MTNGQGNLERIKLCSFLFKSLSLTQVGKKFTTSNKFHHEEYLCVCHEDIRHAHKERVISFEQNFFLQLSASYLVILQDYILS